MSRLGTDTSVMAQLKVWFTVKPRGASHHTSQPLGQHMKRRSFLKALGLIAAAASVNPVELLSQPAPKLDKIALIRKLMEDGINAHDRLIEEAIFSDKKSGSVPTECSFRG